MSRTFSTYNCLLIVVYFEVVVYYGPENYLTRSRSHFTFYSDSITIVAQWLNSYLSLLSSVFYGPLVSTV